MNNTYYIFGLPNPPCLVIVVCEQPLSNQIYLVTFTVDTSFIFTKKSNVAKCFFDICNAEMAQSLSSWQKSEFLNLIILIFHLKKLNN